MADSPNKSLLRDTHQGAVQGVAGWGASEVFKLVTPTALTAIGWFIAWWRGLHFPWNVIFGLFCALVLAITAERVSFAWSRKKPKSGNLLTEGQPQECPDKWLHEIANEQRTNLQRCTRIEGSILQSTRLLGDDPYIDFRFQLLSFSVYKLSLGDDLKGAVYFGNTRLALTPQLTENDVTNVEVGGVGYLTVTQPLRPSEALEILNKQGSFGLGGLVGRLNGQPDIATDINFESRGPVVIDSQFIANYYPKLKVDIHEAKAHSYFEFKTDNHWGVTGSGVLVNLNLSFENQRDTVVKIREYKLIDKFGRITFAETDYIWEKPIKAGLRIVNSGRELIPNLAQHPPIDSYRKNPHEGWLQFKIKGVSSNQYEPVFTLLIQDELAEQHQTDIVAAYS